jgi:hypothetical protein
LKVLTSKDIPVTDIQDCYFHEASVKDQRRYFDRSFFIERVEQNSLSFILMYDWCIKGNRYRSWSFLNITIRQEQIEDYEITERVVECAFASAEHSDKKEHKLVSRIRKSTSFIPKLSLVAVDHDHNKIIGHLLLSK